MKKENFIKMFEHIAVVSNALWSLPGTLQRTFSQSSKTIVAIFCSNVYLKFFRLLQGPLSHPIKIWRRQIGRRTGTLSDPPRHLQNDDPVILAPFRCRYVVPRFAGSKTAVDIKLYSTPQKFNKFSSSVFFLLLMVLFIKG